MKRRLPDDSDYLKAVDAAQREGIPVAQYLDRKQRAALIEEFLPADRKAIQAKRDAIARDQTKLEQLEAKIADIGRQIKAKREQRTKLEQRVHRAELALAEMEKEYSTHLDWAAENIVGEPVDSILPAYERYLSLKLAIDHHKEVIKRIKTETIPGIDSEISTLSKQ